MSNSLLGETELLFPGKKGKARVIKVRTYTENTKKIYGIYDMMELREQKIKIDTEET